MGKKIEEEKLEKRKKLSTNRAPTKTGFHEQLHRKVSNGIPDGLRGRFEYAGVHAQTRVCTAYSMFVPQAQKEGKRVLSIQNHAVGKNVHLVALRRFQLLCFTNQHAREARIFLRERVHVHMYIRSFPFVGLCISSL